MTRGGPRAPAPDRLACCCRSAAAAPSAPLQAGLPEAVPRARKLRQTASRLGLVHRAGAHESGWFRPGWRWGGGGGGGCACACACACSCVWCVRVLACVRGGGGVVEWAEGADVCCKVFAAGGAPPQPFSIGARSRSRKCLARESGKAPLVQWARLGMGGNGIAAVAGAGGCRGWCQRGQFQRRQRGSRCRVDGQSVAAVAAVRSRARAYHAHLG